nr:hypothetical protein [Tanacetum cinerariifolium]
MDSIIPLGQKNTLDEYMILFGADNCPPMLDKDMYDYWKSKMELYILLKRMGVTRTKKYAELSAVKKIQADCDIKATNIILQGFAVPVFSPGDNPIACLNKAMAFLTAVASLSVMLLVLRETMQVDMQGLLNATTVKDKAMLAEAQEVGQILDEEQLIFLADPGVPEGQADFGKRFVPQQELSAGEAFWYHMLNPSTKSSDALRVKIEAPKELPKELLVYVRDTCPNAIKVSAKKVAVTPKTKIKKVRFVERLTSSSNIKQKSMFDGVHDMCLLDFVENVNSRAKSTKKHNKQNIWKPTGHVFTEVGFKWKPTCRTFTIVGNSCPLTRITSANIVPLKKTTSHSVETQKPELKVYSRKPKNVKSVGSSKKTKIVESKNANHSEPNHTWGSNATDIPLSSSLVMTGSIMYVVRCTRPDVAFAQNITNQFQQNPGDLHWTTVKNIMKYLRKTKDMFLVYREVLLIGRVSSSIFATSSTKVEYIAAFDVSKEDVWVRKFISRLGVVPIVEEPVSMYCYNTGAITIANESGITKGARHFRAKVHYLREVIKYGEVKLEKVYTDDNLANPFTKALAFPKYSENRMLSSSSL